MAMIVINLNVNHRPKVTFHPTAGGNWVTSFLTAYNSPNHSQAEMEQPKSSSNLSRWHIVSVGLCAGQEQMQMKLLPDIHFFPCMTCIGEA